MKTVSEKAYAKINLSLDITGRRENGYHELDGVMQSVSLYDDVTVSMERSDETEITLTAEGNPDMPTDGRNLAVKAAARFLETVGVTARVNIHLIKRIPMAGGLAGGSADAAAVLRGCNRLLEHPLSVGSLCALGATLGADIPFCIRGGSMRPRGIGDLLTPVPSMPDCSLVIARRGEGVSTPAAYARLDELYSDFKEGTSRPDAELVALLAALEARELTAVCDHMYNIFEPVVAEQRQDVTLLCNIMKAGGAVAAHMSGSGPSVFGVFEDEALAKAVCEKLRNEGAEAHTCRPMSDNF